MFGHEAGVKESGKEALRHACITPEKSGGQTSAAENLLLKGLSPEQMTHVSSVFGKILQECYSQVKHGADPEPGQESFPL